MKPEGKSGVIVEDPALVSPIPDGVDLSEPIDIVEQVDIPIMPAIITSDEELITVLTSRLIEMPDTDPFYDTFIDDLSNQATIKWYKKGDFEMVRTYVQRNIGKIITRFPDLQELRVSLAKAKLKKGRKQRRKARGKRA